MPKDVIDNELFGHEREAFTGAVSKKGGMFWMAQKGTLFLDEIAEMHPQIPGKAAPWPSRRSRSAGSGDAKNVNVDVRIVAATNRDSRKPFTQASCAKISTIG